MLVVRRWVVGVSNGGGGDIVVLQGGASGIAPCRMLGCQPRSRCGVADIAKRRRCQNSGCSHPQADVTYVSVNSSKQPCSYLLRPCFSCGAGAGITRACHP